MGCAKVRGIRGGKKKGGLGCGGKRIRFLFVLHKLRHQSSKDKASPRHSLSFLLTRPQKCVED